MLWMNISEVFFRQWPVSKTNPVDFLDVLHLDTFVMMYVISSSGVFALAGKGLFRHGGGLRL